MIYEKNKDENNNAALLAGSVCVIPKKSHEIDGENFYEFSVSIKRLSGQVDTIPVTISERTLMGKKLEKGNFVQVRGEYRSYNRLEGQKSKLMLKKVFICMESILLSMITKTMEQERRRRGPRKSQKSI